MFENFNKLHALFEKKKMENSLDETMKAFKLLSHDEVRKTDKSMSEKSDAFLEEIAEKRKQGVPLEYILGLGHFHGHMFFCEPGALIPREETELLVDTVLEKMVHIQNSDPLTIVDMGTGCGSIAVAIALNRDHAMLFASDLKPDTVSIAKKNIAKYHLEERITLFQGDLFAPFAGKGLEDSMDIVVCNPPYIPSTSLKKMAADIINHEPEEAFDGGEFGIAFLRRLINESLNFLKPGGLLVFEIGVGQERLVSRLFKSHDGYENIEFVDDGTNVRVICAEKKGYVSK